MNGRSRLLALRAETAEAGERMEAMRSRFDRLKTRHEDGTAPQAVSSFNLFQTPAHLAARLVAAAGVQPGARVLEPSAGLGRLLDALEDYKPGEVVAVEESADCAGVLYRAERPGVTIKQRDFLSLSAADLGEFDNVVMNPPFKMRADIRHIEHALTFLKPGGTLAALCMDGHLREEKLRHRSATWERIESGTFAAEGTKVATILLTIVNQ